uniref:Uncharacterized protein n=1 Tax=Toxoplasma gondii (strain ATCC 50861 / VEG) TaxID=432359 RepID=A0A0F7UPG5_TOXGV|nr:TPA: hypothetical protein BN1205_059280 [Toxoplasma gondii VEG]
MVETRGESSVRRSLPGRSRTVTLALCFFVCLLCYSSEKVLQILGPGIFPRADASGTLKVEAAGPLANTRGATEASTPKHNSTKAAVDALREAAVEEWQQLIDAERAWEEAWVRAAFENSTKSNGS